MLLVRVAGAVEFLVGAACKSGRRGGIPRWCCLYVWQVRWNFCSGAGYVDDVCMGSFAWGVQLIFLVMGDDADFIGRDAGHMKEMLIICRNACKVHRQAV